MSSVAWSCDWFLNVSCKNLCNLSVIRQICGDNDRKLRKSFVMPMNFSNIDDIKKAGFIGFKTMQELFADSSQLPTIKGVYFVLTLDKTPPVFLPTGTGGHFKGRNPNISLAELKANWIEKTPVIYIGKAGSDNSRSTLKS